MSLMRILKKALPLWCAFFVSGVSPIVVADDCVMPAKSESVKVVHVYDGDTVKLADGRRIRLIGINAPETAKGDHPAETFANESTRFLQQLLQGTGISLQQGVVAQDRYKRTLGHLYANGQHVGRALLNAGLAYHIAIPPNLTHIDCLQAAEANAVTAKRGLWHTSPVRAVASLKGREAGFRLLTGKVAAVKKIRSGWIIEIGDQLAVKFAKDVAQDLGGKAKLVALKGKTIQVRGWIKPKSHTAPAHYQPWLMSIKHAAHLQD